MLSRKAKESVLEIFLHHNCKRKIGTRYLFAQPLPSLKRLNHTHNGLDIMQALYCSTIIQPHQTQRNILAQPLNIGFYVVSFCHTYLFIKIIIHIHREGIEMKKELQNLRLGFSRKILHLERAFQYLEKW